MNDLINSLDADLEGRSLGRRAMFPSELLSGPVSSLASDQTRCFQCISRWRVPELPLVVCYCAFWVLGSAAQVTFLD